MNGNIYLVETITNLHVGDMGDSFSVVDKCVQRDALTGYPAIYASSLKGALRNAAEADAQMKEAVAAVFGEDVTSEKSSKGTYTFHDAHILFYPVRSNIRPYFLATCPSMLRDAAELCRLADKGCAAKRLEKLMKLEPGKLYVGKSIAGANVKIEAENVLLDEKVCSDTDVNAVLGWLGNEPGIALLSDKDMQELMEELPVVARNKLENGISKTLWYEELVPRKTFFLTIMTTEQDNDSFEKFMGSGENERKPRCFQIGANATVGSGLCRFTTL